jgi:hypothetical protein
MGAQPENQFDAERDFYREQLSVAFQHSRPFYESMGTVPEEIVDTTAFDGILRECAPGSLEAARRLGEMAVVLLSRTPTTAGAWPGAPGPWWRDLLSYERACFLQLATTDKGPPTNRPRRGVSALCMNFEWQVPALIEHLTRGEPLTTNLRRPLTLLFARLPDGTPRVVEVGSTVEKVFRATNGLRTEEQIAVTADVSQEETARQLRALSSVGAVVPAMSQDEMARLISSREKS